MPDRRLQHRRGDLHRQRDQPDLREAEAVSVLQHRIERRHQRLDHVVEEMREAERQDDREGGRFRRRAASRWAVPKRCSSSVLPHAGRLPRRRHHKPATRNPWPSCWLAFGDGSHSMAAGAGPVWPRPLLSSLRRPQRSTVTICDASGGGHDAHWHLGRHCRGLSGSRRRGLGGLSAGAARKAASIST